MNLDTSSDEDEVKRFDGPDVTDLLMSTLSGGKDDFGKEVVPPLPLTFDRVCEGRQPASGSILFRLPLEILNRILLSLPDASLAQFGRVNSDCRQLSRSRQAARIRLDYSDRAIQIISLLMREGIERAVQNGRTTKFAMGPVHEVELSEKFNALPRVEQNRRLSAASDMFFGSYFPNILSLLANRVIMPHLQLLEFADAVPLPPSFFNALVNSSVQHLKLDRVKVDQTFTVARPILQPSQSWPLQSLYLEILPKIRRPRADVSDLCTSLLHLCSPTLRYLTWAACIVRDLRTNRLGSTPRFPCLRRIRLHHLRLDDDALLEKLIPDGLECLEVNLNGSPAIRDFFEARGCIPALETFVWHTLHIPETQSISFLQANPQITKLSMPLGAAPALLENRIIPMLSQSFTQLTSLDLVWNHESVSTSAVAAIAGLKTLEQLHLSAGHQIGWRYDWLINHEVMRDYLSTHPLLKKLAFS